MVQPDLKGQGLFGFLGVFSERSSDINSLNMVLQRLLENPAYFQEMDQDEREVVERIVRKGAELFTEIKRVEGLDKELKTKVREFKPIVDELIEWVEEKRQLTSEQKRDVEEITEFLSQLSQAHLNLSYRYAKRSYIKKLKRS